MTAAVTLSNAESAYDRLMRQLGAAWFLLLALLVAAGLGVSPAENWPSRLSGFCMAVFYLFLALLIMIRPPARADAEGILPRIAAFVGTYLPWTIMFFGKSDQTLPNLASSILVLIGTIMALVTVRHLGRSFSITPQARSVVRTGPYRWIRHPLYASEEIAVIGVVLKCLTPATSLIVVQHFGLQVCRILYEEDLLRRSSPDYASYQASTSRLIPNVW